jgi:hypothetical protein
MIGNVLGTSYRGALYFNKLQMGFFNGFCPNKFDQNNVFAPE